MGSNVQSTKTQDLNGMVNAKFVESEASGAIPRSKYLTPFPVKGCPPAALLKYTTLQKVIKSLVQG